MSKAILRPKVQRLVRDAAGVLVDPGDYDLALDEAVRRYSRVKPKRWVSDIAGNGGFDYDLPLEWDDEFSRAQEVEYPAGRREPSIVDKLDWRLYAGPAGTQLRFSVDTPRVGETIRFTFTGLHELAEGSTTIPEADHDVIVYLAAAHCCEQIASHYSNTNDSTLQADTVDHKSRSNEYAARARRFHERASEMLPVAKQGDVLPAAGQTSWGDEADLLTHPER